jgi:nucleotidyltransferase/DNA polymerase involved in DNA repair
VTTLRAESSHLSRLAYASVEQRDNPDLRDKPVAVAGSRERGVVAAAGYEARKFGVRSAMPSVTAKRQYPDLIFVKPRFEVYKAVSQQIREIFAEHTPIIEPLSLDEAYLDVTENLQGIPLARTRLGGRHGFSLGKSLRPTPRPELNVRGSSRTARTSA